MASAEVNPNPNNGPELNLLLAPDTFEPLWKSLFRGLDEFFFLPFSHETRTQRYKLTTPLNMRRAADRQPADGGIRHERSGLWWSG